MISFFTFRRDHIPLYLTFARLIISPFLLPFLLVYVLPYNFWWANAILAFVFVLLGLTDFFDGYLARKFKQESQLGKILDPIADKFLVYSTLIALLTVQKIYFFWVILFIGRDFFIMGLRLVASGYNLVVNVSYWGKIKTVSQVVLLTFLIMNPYQHIPLAAVPRWYAVEWCLLFSALALSIGSAVVYYLNFMDQLSLRNKKEEYPYD